MDLAADMTSAVKRAIAKAVLALHTAMPGRVVSYDAAAQTAHVQPLLKWQAFLPGMARSVVDLPVLPDVLVCHPRAGTKGMHYPLSEGDLVLLVFCSRSIASWRAGSPGTVADPGRVLTPTPLESAIALPLMSHDSAPLTGLSGGATVNIGDDGGALDFVALAAKVTAELDALKNAISGAATTPNDGGAAFKAAIVSALSAWPGDVAAEDVKAT
jgi:hypothetical protein